MKLALNLPFECTIGAFPEPVWRTLLQHLASSSPENLRNFIVVNKELSVIAKEILSSKSLRKLPIGAARPTSARIHKRPSNHRRTVSSVISAQQKMPKTDVNESLKHVIRGSPPSPPRALEERPVVSCKSPRGSKIEKKQKKKKPVNRVSTPISPPEVSAAFLKQLHEELNLYA